MKSTFQEISASPWLTRTFEWGKLLTITGFAQVLIQSVGFLSGILIIRLLPTSEYALYILANTMVGTMAVLADGGISTGVTAQGGQVWKDRTKLGIVLSTGLDLRRKFGVVSLVVAVPVMLFLLRSHNASWLMCALITLAVIPAFFSTLSGSLLQIAPKLQQDVVPLQKNQIAFNVFRLGLLCATLLFMPFAFIAMFASSLPQIWANVRLRAISLPYADWKQKPDVQVRAKIIGFVRRLLPGSIYYCVSGQISIFLISVFGSTSSIAQVGALSRLTMVLSLLSIMVNMLLVPRFARLENERKILLNWFLKIQGILFFCSSTVIAFVWMFPDQILWLLGEKYSGLRIELLLSMVGGCLNLIVGINYLLNSSRGWLLHPLLGISLGIAGIIGGVLLVDVSTLRGVLYFNIFTGVFGLLIHPLFGFLKIVRKVSQYV